MIYPGDNIHYAMEKIASAGLVRRPVSSLGKWNWKAARRTRRGPPGSSPSPATNSTFWSKVTNRNLLGNPQVSKALAKTKRR